MDATVAAYEALDYIIDRFGSDLVLKELTYYMSIDNFVSFLYDFISFYNVNGSDLDAECIESLNEHYMLHC